MLKLIKFFSLMLCAVWCHADVWGAESQISKLIREKRHKVSLLEECAQKTTEFKIAGISTLGLTAVGIAGNVVLSKKNAELDEKINEVHFNLKKEEGALVRLKKEIKIKTKEKSKEKQEIKIIKEPDVKLVKEHSKIAELKDLDNCPGNAFSKIKEHCPECATSIVQERVCFYDMDEKWGVYGFETDERGDGTWLYHIPQEDKYYFEALFIDDCVCKKVQEAEKAKKQDEKK